MVRPVKDYFRIIYNGGFFLEGERLFSLLGAFS